MGDYKQFDSYNDYISTHAEDAVEWLSTEEIENKSDKEIGNIVGDYFDTDVQHPDEEVSVHDFEVIMRLVYEMLSEYTKFGTVSHDKRIGRQSQYVSRFVDGRLDNPNLGEGLRFNGSPDDYHSLEIHKDDVEEFIKRVVNHYAGRLK